MVQGPLLLIMPTLSFWERMVSVMECVMEVCETEQKKRLFTLVELQYHQPTAKKPLFHCVIYSLVLWDRTIQMRRELTLHTRWNCLTGGTKMAAWYWSLENCCVIITAVACFQLKYNFLFFLIQLRRCYFYLTPSLSLFFCLALFLSLSPQSLTLSPQSLSLNLSCLILNLSISHP